MHQSTLKAEIRRILNRMFTEMFISTRLRLAPGDGGRRSPAVGIAVGGVALAVVVMMASMAIVHGFQTAIREKVTGFEASITLRPLGRYYQGEANTVVFATPIQQAIQEAAPGISGTVVINQPVVLKTPDSFAGVVLHAYGPGHDDSFEKGNLLTGELPAKTTDLMLSSATAAKLSLELGDKVDGCFFVDGAMKLRRFTVCGIYSSNFGDYDRLTAYADFGMLSKLRRLATEEGDVIEIRGIPLDKIDEVSLKLQDALAKCYVSGTLTSGLNMTTVFDTGAMYFNWLALLDANVVVILIIMSLVSGFTIVSCVFILSLQRVRMIGVLKSLGATNGQIQRVFILLGARVVGLGLLLGNLIGLALLLLQKYTHCIPLDPESYYLSYVPVELDWINIVMLNIGAIFIAGALLLVPASLVSGISPAKTMHYE